FILQAVRKIPIQYAKRQRTSSTLAPQSTFLPLKVNPAGVIPVIFAMAFFMLPQTLTLFFPDQNWAQTVARFADPSDWFGMIFYVVLIIASPYSYSFVQANPEKMPDNLKNREVMYPAYARAKTPRITSPLCCTDWWL